MIYTWNLVANTLITGLDGKISINVFINFYCKLRLKDDYVKEKSLHAMFLWDSRQNIELEEKIKF